MKIKLYIPVFLISLLGFISSCKLRTEKKEVNATENLPTSFFNHQDSSNVANIKWREYFEDSVLVALIDEGLKSNFDLKNSYQKIEMLRANTLFSKGALLPNLGFASSLGRRRFGKYTMDGVGNFDTGFSPNISSDQFIPEHLPDYYGGLQTSWEIDFRGKLKNKKKAAQANYLASIEGKNWIVTNLVSEIAIAYYELLALDYELQVVQETSILQKQAFEIVLLQKEAGKANELAVQQFEAQYLYSKGLEIDLQQQVIENENIINFLLGRFPQKVNRNLAAFNNSIPVKIFSGIPSELLQNRPDIRQAEQGLIASKADVKAAKAAFYPSFSINATLGLQSFNSRYIISPESMMYNLLGGLAVPLLNRSAIKADFNYANAAQQQALFNYQKNVLQAYIEVYNQVAKLENSNKLYQIKKQEVELLNSSIQTSSELFATGRATYYEIIFSQKNALNSSIQLMEVKKNQFYATINLYKALGGGWK